MSHIKKVSSSNRGPGKGNGRYVVYSKQFNELIDELDDGAKNIAVDITASTTSDQAGATALSAEYNIIGTCATAGDSVGLPAAAEGLHIVVMNHGAAAADVFPAGGDAIDDLGADAAYPLPVEGTLELIGTSASQWQSTNQSAERAEILTAVNTLTEAQSGSTLFLNSATEFATTLPAPALGLRYKFIVTAAPSGAAYTVVTASSANIIEGTVIVNGASVAAANEDTITFADGVALVGDWVEVVSDGTSWLISGVGQAAASITITQAS